MADLKAHQANRPACTDCGLPYTDHGWADFVVSHEVWAKLTASDGAPLLCSVCMVRRAHRLGIEAPGRFASGPFCDTRLLPAPQDDGLVERLREIERQATDVCNKYHAVAGNHGPRMAYALALHEIAEKARTALATHHQAVKGG